MAYQALYRKWRPILFDEIIGQDHIVKPIKNQIINKSIGHAYLFSGTRGTGKTSTAKIFARAVNCLQNINGNPCNECENCISILDDQFIDVVEMDAASNNSVDDIRDLREHVKFSPTKGSYKVYIIDEVHMLSQGAFNALLKTLEEPPEYVLFILATTEAHKIPATILSRCQRFDFKRISYEDLLYRLEYICGQSKIEYETEALKLIIEKSDGAARDSLSSLDQCLSVSGQRLLVSDVISLLGLVESSEILKLMKSISEKDVNSVFIKVNEILKQGKDLTQFLQSIIEVYRDLLVIMTVKDNFGMLINSSKEYMDSIKELESSFSMYEASRGLNLLLELSKSIKYSQNKRIIFEATLLKLINIKTDASIEGLLERIKRLEKIIDGIDLGKIDINAITENKSMLREEISSKIEKKNDDTIKKKEDEFVEFTEDEIGIDDVQKIWELFKNKIASEKKGIIPVFENAEPMNLTGNKLTIGISPENKLFMNLVQGDANLKYLEKAISQFLKKLTSIQFVIKEETNQIAHDPEEQIRNYFKDYKDVLEIK